MTREHPDAPIVVRYVSSVPFRGGLTVVTPLARATGLTYFLGGTTHSYSHLFYVPVVIAGALWSGAGGALTGFVAGLLCGPWLPKDVALGIAQPFQNGFVRLLLFVGVGFLVGDFIRSLRLRIEAMQKLYEQTIVAFVWAVDAKDSHTAEHSLKVAEYAKAIALPLGLGPMHAARIHHAALLHDVGKIAVSDALDAMTSKRAYRRALTEEQAVAEPVAGAGCQFEPKGVAALQQVGATATPATATKAG